MRGMLFIFVFVLLSGQVHSQIFDGIVNEAKRKLERKMEEKIVEAVSDELARRAYIPVEKAMDSLLRKKYADSIAQTKEDDSGKAGTDYANFLGQMNSSVVLPEKYHFDLTQEVEVIDYSNKRNYIKLYYSKNEAIMGIENMDSKNDRHLVVVDVKKDALIMYTTEKNGKKSGQIVPSVLKSMGTMLKNKESKDKIEFKIAKTGNTIKIAGYSADEYKGETKEENVMMYVSQNFPVEWKNNLNEYFSQFAPNALNENMAGVKKGIMLQYENKRKDAEGRKTSWTTKKVTEKSFDINNAEFIFAKKGME